MLETRSGARWAELNAIADYGEIVGFRNRADGDRWDCIAVGVPPGGVQMGVAYLIKRTIGVVLIKGGNHKLVVELSDYSAPDLKVQTLTPAEAEAARRAGRAPAPDGAQEEEAAQAAAAGAGANRSLSFEAELVSAQVRNFIAAYVESHPNSRLSRVRYLAFESLQFDGEKPSRGARGGAQADAGSEEAELGELGEPDEPDDSEWSGEVGRSGAAEAAVASDSGRGDGGGGNDVGGDDVGGDAARVGTGRRRRRRRRSGSAQSAAGAAGLPAGAAPVENPPQDITATRKRRRRRRAAGGSAAGDGGGGGGGLLGLSANGVRSGVDVRAVRTAEADTAAKGASSRAGPAGARVGGDSASAAAARRAADDPPTAR